MFTTLYRKFIPSSFRNIVYDLFLGKVVFIARNFRVIAKSKFTYAFRFALPDTEENKVFSFIGKHGITSYPYTYALEYKTKAIVVEKDAEQNLLFVLHHGRRLYFPEFYSIEKVQKDYRALIIEQDIRSAHRYVRSYDELKDRVLLDVGAAEGIFSLDTIELTKRVVLFEIEEHWQRPLKATFSPWAHKVEIVRKYVSNNTSGNRVTIDDFLKGENENLFIKMDIEGAERLALDGSKKTLASGKNIQVAICSYHRPGDPEYLAEFLSRLGYTTEFADGLMYWNKRVSKGVLRGRN